MAGRLREWVTSGDSIEWSSVVKEAKVLECHKFLLLRLNWNKITCLSFDFHLQFPAQWQRNLTLTCAACEFIRRISVSTIRYIYKTQFRYRTAGVPTVNQPHALKTHTVLSSRRLYRIKKIIPKNVYTYREWRVSGPWICILWFFGMWNRVVW